MSNYVKNNNVKISGTVVKWWKSILLRIKTEVSDSENGRRVVGFEFYTGVNYNEILQQVKLLNPTLLIESKTAFLTEKEIQNLTYPDVTDDTIFGYITCLQMSDFVDDDKRKEIQKDIESIKEGLGTCRT